MKYIPNTPQPDPDLYVLIRAKEGWYWRKKRGLGGGAEPKLNEACQEESRLLGPTTRAAGRLRKALLPYQGWMEFGRFGAKVGAVIREAVKADAWPDYGLLEEYAFQAEHPFEPMLRTSVTTRVADGKAVVRIVIPAGGALVKKSGGAEQYRFALVLVAGDPMDKDLPLETDLVEGKQYDYGGPAEEDCELSIPVPDDGRPWMVCLRIESYLFGELSRAGTHHGLKVVAWG